MSATLRYQPTPSADETPFMIASFPNGPPSAETLQPASEDPLHFAEFAGTNRKKKNRILVGQTQKMKYTALKKSSGPGRKLTKQLVGVRDLSTNEIVLYDIDHIYAMQQSVRGVDHTVADQLFESRDYNAQKRLLVDTFGSRKRQRAVRSQDEAKVDVGNVVAGDSLTQLLSAQARAQHAEASAQAASVAENGQTLSNDAAEVALAVRRKELLPPFDMTAATPAEAFPLAKLLPRAASASLNPLLKTVLSLLKKPTQLAAACEDIPEFVAECLTVVSKMPVKTRKSAVRRVVYLWFLLRLTETPMHRNVAQRPKSKKKKAAGDGDGEEGATAAAVEEEEEEEGPRTPPAILAAKLSIPDICECPEAIAQCFLDTFTERKQLPSGAITFTRSPLLADRLIFYILTLALTIKSFTIDTTVIAADLKLPVNKVLMYYRQMGCKPASAGAAAAATGAAEDAEEESTEAGAASAKKKKSSKSARNVVTLRVPLKFPPRRKMAAARR